MYLLNKYTKCYYNIIERAKSRELPKEIYTEKHHIIPKSIGGNNSKNNLVKLTAREHFICHWLLTKMVNDDLIDKMRMAINIMKVKTPNQQRYYTNITSRVFEKYKSLAAAAQTKSIKGIPQCADHVKKRADAIRGISHTKERKQAIKEGRANGKNPPPWNKGLRYSNSKISIAKKGVPRKKEHIKSAAEARIGQTWWNNGIIQTRSFNCPSDDFVAGRLPCSVSRDAKIYILSNPEFGNIKTTRIDFINTYKLSCGKVSQLLNKKCVQYKGWTLLDIIYS